MDATYNDNSDDEDEDLETQSLISRKKKCRDVHELLEDCLNGKIIEIKY